MSYGARWTRAVRGCWRSSPIRITISSTSTKSRCPVPLESRRLVRRIVGLPATVRMRNFKVRCQGLALESSATAARQPLNSEFGILAAFSDRHLAQIVRGTDSGYPVSRASRGVRESPIPTSDVRAHSIEDAMPIRGVLPGATSFCIPYSRCRIRHPADCLRPGNEFAVSPNANLLRPDKLAEGETQRVPRELAAQTCVPAAQGGRGRRTPF